MTSELKNVKNKFLFKELDKHSYSFHASTLNTSIACVPKLSLSNLSKYIINITVQENVIIFENHFYSQLA